MGNLLWLIKNCLDDDKFSMQRTCNEKSYCSIPLSIWADKAKCRYRSRRTIEVKEAHKSNIPCCMYDEAEYFLCTRK